MLYFSSEASELQIPGSVGGTRTHACFSFPRTLVVALADFSTTQSRKYVFLYCPLSMKMLVKVGIMLVEMMILTTLS